MGPRGSAFLRRLEKLATAGLRDWRLHQAIKAFRGRLSFALMAFVARQLSAAADVLPNDSAPDAPPPPPLGPLFTDKELAHWDQHSDQLLEDPQLHPPPVTRRRPSPDNA